MDENKEMQDLNQIEDAPQEQGQEPEKTENTQNTQYRYTAEQIHQDTQTSQQWGYNSQPYQQQPYQQQYQQPYQGGGQPPYGTPPYGGYYTYQPQPPKKKKSGKGAKAAVAVLCAVLTIGGAFGASVAGSYLGLSKAESDTSAILAEGGSIERTDAKELQNSTYSSVADIVEDVSHSLATIITGSGYATGAIVGEDDEYVYVATAYHILTSTNSVQLIFGEDEENVYTPELQGIDSDTDLAVLKVKKNDIPIVNLSLLFMLAALLISPHLALLALILCLVLGYHISFDKRDAAFASDNLEHIVKNAAQNVKSSVGDIARGFSDAVCADNTKPKSEKDAEDAPDTRSFYQSNPAATSAPVDYTGRAPVLQVPVQVESQDGKVEYTEDKDGFGNATIE